MEGGLWCCCCSVLIWGMHSWWEGSSLDGKGGDDADHGVAGFGWHLNNAGFVGRVADGQVYATVRVVFKAAEEEVVEGPAE